MVKVDGSAEKVERRCRDCWQAARTTANRKQFATRSAKFELSLSRLSVLHTLEMYI